MLRKDRQELEIFFQQTREKIERRKANEERKKQQILKKQQEEQQRINEKLKKQQFKQERTILIYHTRYVEKSPSDDELYLTREELQEWEEKYRPCINWTNWDKIVKQTQKLISAIKFK